MVKSTEVLSLCALIKERASSNFEHAELLKFVHFDDCGKEIVQTRNYQELWKRSQLIANYFKKEGLKKGDRILLMMQNHPEFVEVFVACSILGIVCVLVDPRTVSKKLIHMLNLTQSKGIVAGEYCSVSIEKTVKETQFSGFLWFLNAPKIADSTFSYPFSLISEFAETEIRELVPETKNLDQPMSMIFTSGTTGDPKAIVVSYRKYANSCSKRAAIFGINKDDIMYTGLSLTHANALNISLGVSLYSNIPLVISQKFTKSKLWSLIQKYKCTTLNLLGGMFTAIYAEPQSEKEINNSLRLIIGAGMPKELWRDFATRYEVDILEFYGAAEGGLMVNRPGEGPIGSIGKAVSPYKAMIINNNQLCPPNVKGEIVFYHEDDSPIELEYFSNPKATLDKTREGKLWMGDVGIMDENGWFYFLYRKGNQIRKNGDFISAAFIEKELSVFPDISDVFVYGIPSSNGVAGEKDIVAAIVLNKKIFFDLTTFKQYCHKNLEKNHIPSFFQLVDAIPKTASEKPLERVLASQFNKNASNIFTV